jgi:hypothetical protein
MWEKEKEKDFVRIAHAMLAVRCSMPMVGA